MNCRGVKTRISIVDKYIVKPVSRIRLLEGKSKRSDAEADLTDQYYIFQCILKTDKNVVKTIICGTGAADHFLSLTGEEKPILFNPLKSESIDLGGRNSTSNNFEKWDEEAKQLYNAIHWLIICWDIIPQGALIDIKSNLEKNYTKKPSFGQIKAVNTIISKDRSKLTLTQNIEKFRVNNDIKDFDFSLLIKELEYQNIQSYF